jgi:hypothetical protein
VTDHAIGVSTATKYERAYTRFEIVASLLQSAPEEHSGCTASNALLPPLVQGRYKPSLQPPVVRLVDGAGCSCIVGLIE